MAAAGTVVTGLALEVGTVPCHWVFGTVVPQQVAEVGCGVVGTAGPGVAPGAEPASCGARLMLKCLMDVPHDQREQVKCGNMSRIQRRNLSLKTGTFTNGKK